MERWTIGYIKLTMPFYLYEILILCGKTVLKPHGVPDKITGEDILRKHGAMVE